MILLYMFYKPPRNNISHEPSLAPVLFESKDVDEYKNFKINVALTEKIL